MSLLEWQRQWRQALLMSAEDDEPVQLAVLPGISAAGLGLYQDLLHNTVESALQSIYPYTVRWLRQEITQGASILPSSWPEWVERYRRAYPNPSPLLLGAVSAFPDFLSQQAELMRHYPFLSDLACYEWTEVQVANWLNAPVVAEGRSAEVPPKAFWRQVSPIWNPARCLLTLNYPIPSLLELWNQEEGNQANWNQNERHQSEWRPWPAQTVASQSTSVLLYREPVTLKVRFFHVNPLLAALLTLSEADEQASYYDLLQQLVRQTPMLQSFPVEELQRQASMLFAQCLENGMLLGSREHTHFRSGGAHF